MTLVHIADVLFFFLFLFLGQCRKQDKEMGLSEGFHSLVRSRNARPAFVSAHVDLDIK